VPAWHPGGVPAPAGGSAKAEHHRVAPDVGRAARRGLHAMALAEPAPDSL